MFAFVHLAMWQALRANNDTSRNPEPAQPVAVASKLLPFALLCCIFASRKGSTGLSLETAACLLSFKSRGKAATKTLDPSRLAT